MRFLPTSSVQRVSCIKHFANVSVNTNITYTVKPAWFLWFSDVALNMKDWTFMLVLAQFSLFGDQRIEMWLKQAEDSSVLWYMWYMLDTCLLLAIYCLLVSFDIFFLFLLCFTQLLLYFVCFWCMFLFSGVSLSCRAFELSAVQEAFSTRVEQTEFPLQFKCWQLAKKAISI